MIVTEELIKKIGESVEKDKFTETEIRRIEGLGDMWMSKKNEEELKDSNSTYSRMFNITLNGETYTIYGRN